jgi:hypothetical protein
MKIPCSNCNQRLEIPEEYAGQTIECPACNASLAVPSLAPTPSATPQVKVTTPQAATPQKPTPQRKTAAPPKAASSKKSKSLISKLAVACIASVVILSLLFVLTAKDEAPNISIEEAAEKGNIEAVKKHLAAGTDVNVKIEGGGTPLHLAALYRHKKIVELLIAEGADVDAKSKGRTPLFFAATHGHKEIVELLIAEGADVDAKDRHGNTPLYYATHPDNSDASAETADLLRKHGAK